MQEVINKLKEKFSITELNSIKEYFSAIKNAGYYFIPTNSYFFKNYIKEDSTPFEYGFYIAKDNNSYTFKHYKLYDSTKLVSHSADNIDELIIKIENCFSTDYILELMNDHFEQNQYKNTYTIEKIENGFNIKFIDSDKHIFTKKETFEKHSLFSSLVNVSLLDNNSINLELIK